jgi:hypothetical protein
MRCYVLETLIERCLVHFHLHWLEFVFRSRQSQWSRLHDISSPGQTPQLVEKWWLSELSLLFVLPSLMHVIYTREGYILAEFNFLFGAKSILQHITLDACVTTGWHSTLRQVDAGEGFEGGHLVLICWCALQLLPSLLFKTPLLVRYNSTTPIMLPLTSAFFLWGVVDSLPWDGPQATQVYNPGLAIQSSSAQPPLPTRRAKLELQKLFRRQQDSMASSSSSTLATCGFFDPSNC